MMKTELDNIMEWYEINLDCQRVMKNIIRKNPEIIPLHSILVTKGVKETNELLETSINELNDLTIVSLISIFEQTLLEYLKHVIQTQMAPYNEITEKISKYTIQPAERGRFIEIIELFKPLVDTKLIGMVKQVYEYRNWVAHGKISEKTPAKIDPISAYERLSCRVPGTQTILTIHYNFNVKGSVEKSYRAFYCLNYCRLVLEIK